MAAFIDGGSSAEKTLVMKKDGFSFSIHVVEFSLRFLHVHDVSCTSATSICLGLQGSGYDVVQYDYVRFLTTKQSINISRCQA